MNVALALAGLWLAFALTHMGLSSLRWRPRLVGALGEPGFQAVYSLVALAFFVPLCWLYFANQHAGPHLWYWGHLTAVRWVGYAGMAVALSLVFGGLLQPSPASLGGPEEAKARGPLRITRHPVFMGLGLFGAVHLLVANVSAAELVFFAGFPLFTWVGGRHQDARHLAARGEPVRRFQAEAPFLTLRGAALRQGLREMPLAAALGVAAAAVIRWFHPSWFGGAA